MDQQQTPHSKMNLEIDRELALKNFFETSPMMMGIADLIGEDIRHVRDNDAAGKYFGKNPEEMSGKLASEMGIPDETLKLWVKNYKKAESSGRPVNFEYKQGKEDEKYFQVAVSYMGKSYDGHSRFSYIVNDVTDMREAKNELQKTNATLQEDIVKRTEELELEKNKFDCLLKAAPIGIAYLDCDLRYEIINPVLAGMNGYTVEEHHKKHIRDILPDQGERITPVLESVLKGENIRNLEFKTIPKSDPGKEHYFVGNYFPVKLKDKILGVGAAIVDITARKEMELELRQIANAMPQIVWTARPDGHVDWYNEWWYNYTGASRGSNWHDEETPMHPDDIAPTWERWKKSLETGELYQMEYRFKRASDCQYRWHLGRAVPVKDESGKIIKWIGSNTDVHEQKLLVKKLEEERDLREYFIATLSHDLRTPLTAAKMSAQLLAKKSGDNPAINKTAFRISENMDRADSMIQDLLDATRVKAGEKIQLKLGHCNLTQIIVDTVGELSTIHGDRFILNAGDHIEGQWSCSGVRRILENLCTNAIKYGDPLGPVSITLKDLPEKVSIEVHNEGNPIPQEEIHNLFRPFTRARSVEEKGMKGWGIGLTLVKGLTEAHDGTVFVESSPEKGTTFRICLPKNASKN